MTYTTRDAMVLLSIVSVLFLTGFTHKVQTEDLATDAFVIKHRIIAPGLELDEEEGEYEDYRNVHEIAGDKCAVSGLKHTLVKRVFQCLKLSCLRFDYIYRCVEDTSAQE